MLFKATIKTQYNGDKADGEVINLYDLSSPDVVEAVIVASIKRGNSHFKSWKIDLLGNYDEALEVYEQYDRDLGAWHNKYGLEPESPTLYIYKNKSGNQWVTTDPEDAVEITCAKTIEAIESFFAGAMEFDREDRSNV